jgi:hypothetical protein
MRRGRGSEAGGPGASTGGSQAGGRRWTGSSAGDAAAWQAGGRRWTSSGRAGQGQALCELGTRRARRRDGAQAARAPFGGHGRGLYPTHHAHASPNIAFVAQRPLTGSLTHCGSGHYSGGGRRARARARSPPHSPPVCTSPMPLTRVAAPALGMMLTVFAGGALTVDVAFFAAPAGCAAFAAVTFAPWTTVTRERAIRTAAAALAGPMAGDGGPDAGLTGDESALSHCYRLIKSSKTNEPDWRRRAWCTRRCSTAGASHRLGRCRHAAGAVPRPPTRPSGQNCRRFALSMDTPWITRRKGEALPPPPFACPLQADRCSGLMQSMDRWIAARAAQFRRCITSHS